MYLKKVLVGDSTIHGSGVFADEDIKSGEIVWKFDPKYDLTLTVEKFDLLTEKEKEALNRVAYLSAISGLYVFPPENDPARYTNHDSEQNNLTVMKDGQISPEPYFIANRDICKGEELTNNYNEFDEAIKTQPAGQDWLK